MEGKRISDLPPTIITRILSSLSAKEVVITSCLSKAWEHRWTHIYNIVIDDTELATPAGRTRKIEVVGFINRVLSLCLARPIKKFHLLLSKHYYDPQLVAIWITSALLKDVEDLKISFNHEGVVLPRLLLISPSLTKIELQLPCTFTLPVQNRNQLFGLKILYLDGVEIKRAPELTGPARFPVLEEFRLVDCKMSGYRYWKIEAPSLTHFMIQHNSYFRHHQCSFKISRANLSMFEIHGSLLETFDMGSSLVHSVFANCREPEGQAGWHRNIGTRAWILLRECRELHFMALSADTIEAMYRSKPRANTLPHVNSLKQLDFFNIRDIGPVLELLREMPGVEKIKFNLEQLKEGTYDFPSVQTIPRCIVSTLNEVEFCGFTGVPGHVNLANFLFRNAVSLKKLAGLRRNRREETPAHKNFWDDLTEAGKNGVVQVLLGSRRV